MERYGDYPPEHYYESYTPRKRHEFYDSYTPSGEPIRKMHHVDPPSLLGTYEQQYPSHFQMTHRTSNEPRQNSDEIEHHVEKEVDDPAQDNEQKEYLVAHKPPSGLHQAP